MPQPQIPIIDWAYGLVQDVLQRMGKNECQHVDKAFKYFFTASAFWGAWCFFDWTKRLLRLFSTRFVRPLFQSSNRMFQLYSRKSQENRTWAVVTGGSDGIGLAMAKNLARQKFNICIVSRNENKMKEKLEEISKEVGDPNLKTRYIVADFSKLHSIEDYKYIKDQLNDVDVGVLILNAGAGAFGCYKDVSELDV